MNHTTAKASCFARAYHAKNNRAPIFADSAAFLLLGDEYGQIAESMTQGIGFFLPGFGGSRETRVNALLAGGAGEPMKARYTYAQMEALLAESGFLIYEHLDHAELTRQYFFDYNRENPAHPMSVPEGVCCVLAVRKGDMRVLF